MSGINVNLRDDRAHLRPQKSVPQDLLAGKFTAKLILQTTRQNELQ